VDIDLGKLRKTYRDLLLDGIAPFWLRHGIDREHGGVLSVMDEVGNVLSGDKYIWSQARSVWTFAALYNRVERRPEFLDAAANSVRFLMAHGRDAEGRWVYHTDRQGAVLEGPISIYSDLFAVYGFSEYYRAARDAAVLDCALKTYERVRKRIRQPDFHETAPYSLPVGRKLHGIPMIMTEVTNELLQTTGNAELERVLDASIQEILDRFLEPRRGLVLEYRDHDYSELPPPEGTAVMPATRSNRCGSSCTWRGGGETANWWAAPRRSSAGIWRSGGTPNTAGCSSASMRMGANRSFATPRKNCGGRTRKRCMHCCWRTSSRAKSGAWNGTSACMSGPSRASRCQVSGNGGSV